MNQILLELFEKAKQGDEEAFQKLYQHFYPMVYNYTFKLCNNNHEDTKEICQEVFVQAWNHIPTLRMPHYFPLWLKRVARNKSIKLFEKNKSILMDPVSMEQEGHIEPHIDFNPKQFVNNLSDQEILHYLINQLTPSHKEVIKLHYFQQLSLIEIQKRLNISKGTVKSRIFYARKHLKSLIDEFEEKEHRKIYFHMEFIFPPLICILFLKIKSFINTSNKSFYSTLQIASITTFVLTGIITSNQLLQKSTINQNNAIRTYEFTPISYKGHIINTPMEAYYILLFEAPTSNEFKALQTSELNALKPLLNALLNSNSSYAKEVLDYQI